MATAPRPAISSEGISAQINTSCYFVQSLMTLQRAAQLIPSRWILIICWSGPMTWC
jgi:hypothetical protein